MLHSITNTVTHTHTHTLKASGQEMQITSDSMGLGSGAFSTSADKPFNSLPLYLMQKFLSKRPEILIFLYKSQIHTHIYS